ncbi:LppU/SCO3897 family protein [Streptomyces bauhiniae]
MRSLKRQGVFCRTCALAVFREMQAETLIAGWWGLLSVVITPFVLLANLGALSGIRRIPAPATPGWRPPLDPGKPVFQRPAGVLVLIPLGVLGLVVTLVTVLMLGLFPDFSESKTNLTTGSCARNDGTWTDPDLKTAPCDSADAQYRVMLPGENGCEDGDYLASPEDSADGIGRCLRPMR